MAHAKTSISLKVFEVQVYSLECYTITYCSIRAVKSSSCVYNSISDEIFTIELLKFYQSSYILVSRHLKIESWLYGYSPGRTPLQCSWKRKLN